MYLFNSLTGERDSHADYIYRGDQDRLAGCTGHLWLTNLIDSIVSAWLHVTAKANVGLAQARPNYSISGVSPYVGMARKQDGDGSNGCISNYTQLGASVMHFEALFYSSQVQPFSRPSKLLVSMQR